MLIFLQVKVLAPSMHRFVILPPHIYARVLSLLVQCVLMCVKTLNNMQKRDDTIVLEYSM